MSIIYLNPVESSDIYTFKEWRNDPELMSRTREWKMLSFVNQDKWFDSLYGDRYPSNLMYSIFNKSEEDNYDWFLIGCCGLCYIDYINRSAEVSIYIGDKNSRGKGYAFDALSKLIGKASLDMNMRRLFAEIYDFNEPSIKLFEKLGFQKEATLKQTVFKNGRWCDSHFYTLFI